MRPQNGKYFTATEVQRSTALLEAAKYKTTPVVPNNIHFDRWHYCAAMMIRELLKLKDKRIQRIFNKYYCVALETSVGLRFPDNMKESNLPIHLRLSIQKTKHKKGK